MRITNVHGRVFVADNLDRAGASIDRPLIWRWLHNALLEDALDKAAVHLGCGGPRSSRPVYVRVLRWAAGRRGRL